MTINLAYKEVKCSGEDCGKVYICTPEQDYFHLPLQPPETWTAENGVCWDCMLKINELSPRPEPEYIGPKKREPR